MRKLLILCITVLPASLHAQNMPHRPTFAEVQPYLDAIPTFRDFVADNFDVQEHVDQASRFGSAYGNLDGMTAPVFEFPARLKGDDEYAPYDYMLRIDVEHEVVDQNGRVFLGTGAEPEGELTLVLKSFRVSMLAPKAEPGEASKALSASGHGHALSSNEDFVLRFVRPPASGATPTEIPIEFGDERAASLVRYTEQDQVRQATLTYSAGGESAWGFTIHFGFKHANTVVISHLTDEGIPAEPENDLATQWVVVASRSDGAFESLRSNQGKSNETPMTLWSSLAADAEVGTNFLRAASQLNESDDLTELAETLVENWIALLPGFGE